MPGQTVKLNLKQNEILNLDNAIETGVIKKLLDLISQRPDNNTTLSLVHRTLIIFG